MHSTHHSHDDVYVISDLHMGGSPGFQIFDAGELLAATIDLLTSTAPRKRVALVINGDSVDFIAEQHAVYFDAKGAIAKLNRIANDDAFKPVWQALARFVKAKNRTLYINLGNHDLELALPWVREALLELLTGGKPELRGKVELVFDGTGVCCQVGSANVVCLHGNEVDTWNVCDYEELRRQGRDRNLELSREMWTPNAGTKLVIDVMNDIKAKYPFVDLLKPETEAVLPTLYALDQEVKSKLPGILKVAGRLVVDKVKHRFGFLEGDDDSDDSTSEQEAAVTVDMILSEAFASSRGPRTSDDATALLRQTEQRFRKRVNPTRIGHEAGDEQLGVRDAIVGFFTGKSKNELLREALEGLKDDDTFDVHKRDSTFEDMDEFAGSDIDFLVTGHTHLYRALRRPGGGFYFNSGTWVRLIQLTQEVLDSEAKFDKYFRAIVAGTIEALDKEPGMVLRRPTLVAISRDKTGVVTGSLQQAISTADGVTLEEIPDTRFVKG